jgi:gliding motility-associated-like protein
MNEIAYRRISGLQSLLCLLFLLLIQSVSAALPDFTLTVNHTNETCAGNATLTFSVSGTDPNATITYTVYQLPNTTTPIATLGGNTLGGLTAGNYRIIATQTLGSESNTKQQDVTITSSIVPLAYQVFGQPAVCGDDGRITVSVTQGIAVSYEILSGPVTRPLQSTPVFDLLPPGNYQTRVFNNCGEGVVQNFTLIGYTAYFSVALVGATNPELPSCDSITVGNPLSVPNGSIIAWPLQVEYTVYPPSGSPIVLTNIQPSGPPFSGTLGYVIPFYHNQQYSYDVKVTDNCGNVYHANGNILNKKLEVTVSAPPVGCNDKKMVIKPANFVGPFTVTFLQAPVGFDPLVYNAGHPGPFIPDATYYNPNVQLLPGFYQVQITDACGRTAIGSTTIVFDSPPAGVAAFIMMGCEVGQGAMSMVSTGSSLVSVIIQSAPLGYPNALPHDVSFNLVDGVFYMNSLPTGSYTIRTVDLCDNIRTTAVNLLPYNIITNQVDVVPACNSFGVALNYDDTALQNQYFWLQQQNAAGLWVHPQTGLAGGALVGSANAIALTNNSNNPNLQFTGHFRVVLTFQVYGNGTATMTDCMHVLDEFDYSGGPEITSIDSFSCSPNAADVIVTATGVGPLNYMITTQNGSPFIVNNGTNPLFAGLTPAIYNFQVEDACGNILNRIFDVTTPIALTITPSGFCEGQQGTLTIPLLPFLQYEWYKGNNTGNILSTTNTLTFPAFNSTTDAGMYHVHIAYPNANSCINQVIDFEISPNLANPQAGTGIPATYCGTQGNIDLFGLLTGTFDDFGTWTQLEGPTGALSNSIFDTAAAGPGLYTFKYTVNGLCNFVDETTVDIAINAIPSTPLPFLEQELCSNLPLQLLATTIPNAMYSWSGPNGFHSNDQNPIINNPTPANNGTYSVKVTVNGCDSQTATIDISILPMPQFIVLAGCDGNDFVLSAATPNPEIDPSLYTFTWTGPDGFNATGSQQTINGLPGGMYSVTITAPEVCPFTGSVTIDGTHCGIPKGVSPNDDGDNDSWDLSGFDIETVQIFNRYGMEVYDRAHYISEWYGQDKKGHMLPSATYYYLVKLASGEAKSGWVYLNREY